MSRLLLGLRLARRDLRRAPLRALLVIGLVILPTAGMAAIVVMVATSRWSPLEYREAHAGQAELEASWVGSDFAVEGVGTVEHLESLLPEGADVVVVNETHDEIPGEDVQRSFAVSDLDIAAGSSAGRFRSIEGTPPEGPGEAAITAAMARERKISRGDVVSLDLLGRDVSVTAIVDPWAGAGKFFAHGEPDLYLGAPLASSDQGLVLGPGMEEILSEVGSAYPGAYLRSTILVDLPEGMLPAAESYVMLDAAGNVVDPDGFGWYMDVGATHPALAPQLAPAAEAGWRLWPVTEQNSNVGPVLNFTYLFGSVGLVILGTIVTAAFAVGARRQLRSIGLLACTGAPPAVLRWYLIAQGVICGIAGSLLGMVVAVVAIEMVPELILRSFLGHAVSGIEVPFGGLLPVLLIGTVVAAAAAAIPAWTAARVPTLAALAGRRPQGRVPRFIPVLGALAVGGGCLLLFGAVGAAVKSGGGDETLAVLMALGGSLLVIMGSTAMAPTLVGALETGVKRAPSSWRLAGRSLARSRVRSSAVVAAIVAATIVLVAASTLLVSLSRPSDPLDGTSHLPRDRMVASALDDAQLRELTALLPGAEAVELPRYDGSVLVSISDPEVGPMGFYTSVSEVGPPVSATEEVLDLYGVPDRLRDVIEDGGWVLTEDLGGYDVELEVVPMLGPVGPPEDPATVYPVLPASPWSTVELGGSFDSSLEGRSVPRALAAEETLAAAGFVAPHPVRSTVLKLERPLQEEQADAVDALRTTWSESAEPGWVELPPEPSSRLTVAQIRMLVLTAVFLAVLAVVAVGLLLAGRDSRDESAVLSAVGAPPAVIRRVGAARAVLLVAVAVVLGLPAGLIAAWSLFSSVRSETADWYWYPSFETDPQIMAFVLLMAPLIGLVTWAAALVRDTVRPTRPVEMGAWE